MESDIVSGQQSAWVLLKKLGEGDAGEVYLVESLLEKQPAILKRPGKSPFASDIIRQTSQITTESKIIKALNAYFDLESDMQVSVPRLLDQSKPGTAFSERLFIVIEKAVGFDLSLLAKACKMGLLSGVEAQADTAEERRFLHILAESNFQGNGPVTLSARIVLNVLHNLLEMFERIHANLFDIEGLPAHGILWNDVKPEHLFWDPRRARLMIIDWGNGQFLEQSGVTKDRQFTIQDDYKQFIEAMGRFLEMAAPELLMRLEWPSHLSEEATNPMVLHALREKIWETLQQELDGLSEARRREMDLLRAGAQISKKAASQFSTGNPLEQLEQIQREIIQYGELPDSSGALYFAQNLANLYAEQHRLEEVQETCEWALNLPGSNTENLRLIARLSQIASRTTQEEQHEMLRDAVQSALGQDWGGVLWNLTSTLRNAPEPAWWNELIIAVRQQQFGEKAGDLQPLVVARRSLLTLQAMLERMQDQDTAEMSESHTQLAGLVRRLREDILTNWVQIDPAPPYSNLTYQDVDKALDEIGAFLPDAKYSLDRALEEPREQVQQVLADWERGDFQAVYQGLRKILLWDPDRKRVLHAEQALHETPYWLEKVRFGPQNGEHYQRFVTDLEFEGRELRNQIGPAGWLDLILEGCRQLRKGIWPPDLFTSMPLLVREMPWLTRFERQERLPEVIVGQETAETAKQNGHGFVPVVGVVRGKLGAEQDINLIAPLDAWIAEARGSSARVFTGQWRDAQGEVRTGAVKLMRMDKIDYAQPLFREEVLVLNAMAEVPGITRMMECEFLQINEEGKLPTDREASMAQPLNGSLIRIGPKYGQEFVNQLEGRISEGWTPYLVIEQQDWRENLLTICDAGMTGGSFRPVAELLLMCIQICDILSEAHRKNIVYRDHKILHYYWREALHGVYAIDWNVARLHPDGLSDYEKQMDLVQFGARALHHILTGRTAPGALPLGPTRPEEIEQSAKSYQVQWTYDDQRLPEDLRAILERVLAGEYNNAEQLRDELKQSFLQLPDV